MCVCAVSILISRVGAGKQIGRRNDALREKVGEKYDKEVETD